MNAQAALLTRTERHLPITDWLSELVLEVLDGASTHQAANVVHAIFPDKAPGCAKLRLLAQSLMFDRDRVPKTPRRITVERLRRAAKFVWNVHQAAVQFGVTSSEVILTINDTPRFFVSHREWLIVDNEDHAGGE